MKPARPGSNTKGPLTSHIPLTILVWAVTASRLGDDSRPLNSNLALTLAVLCPVLPTEQPE